MDLVTKKSRCLNSGKAYAVVKMMSPSIQFLFELPSFNSTVRFYRSGPRASSPGSKMLVAVKT